MRVPGRRGPLVESTGKGAESSDGVLRKLYGAVRVGDLREDLGRADKTSNLDREFHPEVNAWSSPIGIERRISARIVPVIPYTPRQNCPTSKR